ncbi:MAG TPA: family 16 glycoside hydrolase, partial [Verrucomicrobiae bacterium]|nr:family 16 glycoside hydrolase [Verrucomicrobiae bacterium]
MKIAFILLFLMFALVGMAPARDAIDPTNRLELFNGKDFSGWTFCMRDHADPRQTWSVTNGVIHCTGEPTGYLRTTQ